MPTVFITGANRGLGLEFARQYAADGWRVIATCRDPGKANDLKAVEGDVIIETLDVDDTAAAKKLADNLDDGAIDVLINNAGIYGPREEGLDNIDYAAWEKVLHTNVLSPMAVTAAFAGKVAASEHKTIAVLSSILASIESNVAGGKYIYRSSKAAVNAIFKSLSIDLGGQGIKVVMLHPGWAKTDMGGPKAAVDIPDSVTGLRAVLAKLTDADNGGFFTYEGKTLPW
ncbi:MAG: SDR family oxidoreductase [Rhodospirillales bacterium]|nr:SDR family oxidoreductase [Rhodospirillales bacterium]